MICRAQRPLLEGGGIHACRYTPQQSFSSKYCFKPWERSFLRARNHFLERLILLAWVPRRTDRAVNTDEMNAMKSRRAAKLSTSMTETEFDNGYWYADDLKKFAEKIGVPSARRLRKEELEGG